MTTTAISRRLVAVAGLDNIGPHDATTLRKWRESFFSSIEAVCTPGFPERFIRMWEFYLRYCEGGFAELALGDVHMLLARPGNRSESPLT